MNSALELQNLYLDYMDDTESPIIYHRWSFLVGVGALLERNIYLPFGPSTIYPNQYAILLGPPAARKSTAISALGELLTECGYKNFSSDRTSKEKFIQDMSEGFKVSDELDDLNLDDEIDLESIFNKKAKADACNVFIKASELQDFMGQSNSDLISWLSNIWDNPAYYDNRVKNGKSDRINKPTINMLGGATGATFKKIFPLDILEQGMLSRMLLIHGEGARKKIAFPKPLDKQMQSRLVKELIKIQDKVKGEVTLSDKAKNALEEIYNTWEGIPDSRFSTYTGRRFTHLLKLCMVNAAMNLSLEISYEDVILANTILSYTENFMPQALGEFGTTELGKVTDTVFRIIKGSQSKGISFTDIVKKVKGEVADKTKIAVALDNLKSLGKIDNVQDDTSLSAVKSAKYLAIEAPRQFTKKYIDYSLLREAKDSDLGEIE